AQADIGLDRGDVEPHMRIVPRLAAGSPPRPASARSAPCGRCRANTSFFNRHDRLTFQEKWAKGRAGPESAENADNTSYPGVGDGARNTVYTQLRQPGLPRLKGCRSRFSSRPSICP